MRETSSALASPRVRSAAHKSKSTANWRGSGKVFGDKLQWVMQDGRPGAAIIPVRRVNITKDGAEREVQELKVFRRPAEPLPARTHQPH